MPKRKGPALQIAFEGVDCFVILDGLRIAKRHSRQWVSLEPGWTVRGVNPIEVEFKNGRVH